MKQSREHRFTAAGFLPDKNIFVPLFLLLLMFSLLAALQSYFILSAETAYYRSFFPALISKTVYYLYFLLPAYIVFILAAVFPLKRKTFIQWILLHAIIVTVSFVLHQSLSIAVDTLLWGEEYSGAFVYLLFNNPSFWIEVLGYGIFVAGFLLIDFQRQHRENEIRYSEIEADLVKAQLHEVRSRIHPQFLFNTLGCIGDLLLNSRNKEANRILSLLSDFLRITVYDVDKDEVSFAEEMKFLDIYASIETIRLAPDFRIDNNVPESMMTSIVPNSILQPIVEEIVYWEKDHAPGRRGITITAGVHSGMTEILLRVTQKPGGTISAGEFSSGEVVAIINKRIEYLYGSEFGVTCRDRADELEVKVLLPFRTEEGNAAAGKEQRYP